MKWTDQEIAILKQMYAQGKDTGDIGRALGGRTGRAVRSKAHSLGISHAVVWPPEDDAFLRENWETMSHAQMGGRLGRGYRGVRNRCWRLGLTAPSDWSAEEVAYLRGVYESAGSLGPVNQRGIAEHLGRSRVAVSIKARRLGLANPDREKFWTEDSRKQMGEKIRQGIKERGHPRGFLGHTHSEKVCQAQSRRSTAMWSDHDHYLNSEEYKQAVSDRMMGRKPWRYNDSANPYSRCKMGRRPDLNNVFFRSSWEANIARYLNFLVEQGEALRWEYEPITFEFHAIKRGTRSYTPDFRIWKPNGDYEWWEVKGWMDAKSKTRLKRFAKYYPEENDKLSLIGPDEYRAIAKFRNLISPHWES